MKRIINGRKYDTETAEDISSHLNGHSMSDFQWMRETLFRKKTGEFFLYGEGGAMSKYSQSCGQNSWTGGSAIQPFTEQEAKAWLEEHGTATEYEAVFGEVAE